MVLARSLFRECVAAVARAVPGKLVEGPVLARDVLVTILTVGKHTGPQRQARLLVGALRQWLAAPR
jgi:hypothetical protein